MHATKSEVPRFNTTSDNFQEEHEKHLHELASYNPEALKINFCKPVIENSQRNIPLCPPSIEQRYCGFSSFFGEGISAAVSLEDAQDLAKKLYQMMYARYDHYQNQRPQQIVWYVKCEELMLQAVKTFLTYRQVQHMLSSALFPDPLFLKNLLNMLNAVLNHVLSLDLSNQENIISTKEDIKNIKHLIAQLDDILEEQQKLLNDQKPRTGINTNQGALDCIKDKDAGKKRMFQDKRLRLNNEEITTTKDFCLITMTNKDKEKVGLLYNKIEELLFENPELLPEAESVLRNEKGTTGNKDLDLLILTARTKYTPAEIKNSGLVGWVKESSFVKGLEKFNNDQAGELSLVSRIKQFKEKVARLKEADIAYKSAARGTMGGQ